MKKYFVILFSILMLSFYSQNSFAQKKLDGKTIKDAQTRIESLGTFISSMPFENDLKTRISNTINYTKTQMSKATSEIADYKALTAKKSELYKELLTNIGSMVGKKDMKQILKWNKSQK